MSIKEKLVVVKGGIYIDSGGRLVTIRDCSGEADYPFLGTIGWYYNDIGEVKTGLAANMKMSPGPLPLVQNVTDLYHAGNAAQIRSIMAIIELENQVTMLTNRLEALEERLGNIVNNINTSNILVGG